MSDQVQLLDQHGHPLQMMGSAHFAASRVARELRDWTPSLESADAELLGENTTIAARSYDLERNNGIAAGAIRTQIDNIVGTGLRLAAKPDFRVLGKTKEWAAEWARNAEAHWRTFADSTDFDAARQLNFGGMTVLQMRAAFLAGEGLGLVMWLPDRPGAKWATAIQAIDPARLGTCDGMITQTMRDGVELNDMGEPIAYHIRKTHPGDVFSFGASIEFERVEARTAFGRRRVIHLYEKLRAGQTRGKAILASVMGAFKMLDRYQRSELQATVANALIAAFIETPMGGGDIAELFGTPDKYMKERNAAGFDVKLEGASVIPLFPGDKMSAFNPSRPNTAYSAFVEAVLRYISAGLNMPYELLMKDFSKTNYSSARAALLEAWRYFMAKRDWIATYWADPIYELWLEEAVSKGIVDAPDFYENRAAYARCRWIGPGRGLLDPLKEAQASDTRMKMGMSTLEQECAEQGDDWEEVLQQRARERDYALALGMTDIHAGPVQGGAPGTSYPYPPAVDDEKTDKPTEEGQP
jgi:lambda family phage portal protein